MLSKMKRKLMICAMALCICAGLTGNTGEVSVWASEGSSSDAVRIGALKGPTAMGMAQLLDEDGYDFTILYEVSSGQVFVFSFFSKAAISNLRLFRQVIHST